VTKTARVGAEGTSLYSSDVCNNSQNYITTGQVSLKQTTHPVDMFP